MKQFLKKASKGAKEIPIEISRFLNRQYPNFVVSDRISTLDREVPVFMFHSVQYETLKAQLDYLQKNNYQTLTLRQFSHFLQGKDIPNRASVLLTFDDGEKSWYTTAFPLLKQYGFNAVGFVVPHYIQAKPSEPSASKSWLSWAELSEMEQSGCFEFESHSHYHAQIFIDSQLVDFYHPDFTDSLRLDVPWLEDGSRYTNYLQLGTPIYNHAPRLKGKPQYFDSQTVRNACISWVENHGGSRFFEQTDWRKELRQCFESTYRDSSKKVEKYATETQRKARMLEDLAQSRDVLSRKLNKSVRHLCYPWGMGSEEAVSLSKKAGYESNFWVTLDRRNSSTPGDSPYYIPRLKDDYLFRLPGRGRHSLWKIFQAKFNRRRQKLEIY